MCPLNRGNSTLKEQLQSAKRRENELMDTFLGQPKSTRTTQWLDKRLADLEDERKGIEVGIARLERERVALAASEPDPKNVKATLEHVFKNFGKVEPSVQRNFVRQVFEFPRAGRARFLT